MRLTLATLLLCLSTGFAGAAVNPYMPLGTGPGPNVNLGAHPFYSCVTNVYVDPINGRTPAAGGTGTQSNPWKTLADPDDGYPNKPVPGECINALPGLYPITQSLVKNNGGNANTPTGYVVYRCTVQGACHVQATAPWTSNSQSGDLVVVGAAYLVFDGFEFDGNNDLAAGSGINGCIYGGQPYGIAHHLVVWNSTIHDVGAAGLASCTAEFISWQNNTVYGASHSSPWQTSGISVWQPATVAHKDPWDNVTYPVVIAHNIAHDNYEGAALATHNNQGSKGTTDGNAIIIDTTKGKNYPGPILVYGNVAYHNGGGGVHIFLSQNVFVANNTAYGNRTDVNNPGTARGDCDNGGSSNITWINNVCVAVPGAGILADNVPFLSYPVNGPATDTGSNNIFWGAKPGVTDLNLSQQLLVDPKMGNPAAGDFRLTRGSPGLGGGTALPFNSHLPVNIGAEY